MSERRLSFVFEPRKFAETVAYFSSRGVTDLTKLKAAKLVYFADRAHLLRFGRPIVGGQYYCMDKGPVPSEGLDTINAAVGQKSSAESVQVFLKKIEFRRTGWQIHHRLVAKSAPDRDAFSDSELQVLESVASELGRLDVGDLINMSHAHEAWLRPDGSRSPGRRAEMSYEMFFHENPVDKPVLQAAKIEQEDRDFADAFARATARRRASAR